VPIRYNALVGAHAKKAQNTGGNTYDAITALSGHASPVELKRRAIASGVVLAAASAATMTTRGDAGIRNGNSMITTAHHDTCELGVEYRIDQLSDSAKLAARKSS
jgi:hypothetical protein